MIFLINAIFLGIFGALWNAGRLGDLIVKFLFIGLAVYNLIRFIT